MSIITISKGSYTHGRKLAERVADLEEQLDKIAKTKGKKAAEAEA